MADTEFSIGEMGCAWEEFLRLGARGRDWPAWAALFTDDATYVEHCIGRFHGAAGVLAFILEAMKPVAPMTFSLDWAILQPPYVAFDIWNHLPDPGDGQRYSFSNLTLLEYAGNGRWKLEEDFYAPRDSARSAIPSAKACWCKPPRNRPSPSRNRPRSRRPAARRCCPRRCLQSSLK